MIEELKEFGLHVEHSDSPEREPIDFEIRNDQDELFATVWGSHPTDDIQIDCDHDLVEYDDDETVGTCPICGATCFWHWEADGEGGRRRVAHEWNKPDKIGGIVGKELARVQEKW